MIDVETTQINAHTIDKSSPIHIPQQFFVSLLVSYLPASMLLEPNVSNYPQMGFMKVPRAKRADTGNEVFGRHTLDALRYEVSSM